MANIRKPDDKEGLPPSVKGRSRRLRNLVSGGEFAGNDKIVLIYWSQSPNDPKDKGRWVMWEDPDPLLEDGVTIGAPDNSDDPD